MINSLHVMVRLPNPRVRKDIRPDSPPLCFKIACLQERLSLTVTGFQTRLLAFLARSLNRIRLQDRISEWYPSLPKTPNELGNSSKKKPETDIYEASLGIGVISCGHLINWLIQRNDVKLKWGWWNTDPRPGHRVLSHLLTTVIPHIIIKLYLVLLQMMWKKRYDRLIKYYG